MHPQVEEGQMRFTVSPINLEDPYSAGDCLDRAQELYEEISRSRLPGAPSARTPLNVIRALIDDPDAATIGGDVQIGFTLGAAFTSGAHPSADSGEGASGGLLAQRDLHRRPTAAGPVRPGADGIN